MNGQTDAVLKSTKISIWDSRKFSDPANNQRLSSCFFFVIVKQMKYIKVDYNNEESKVIINVTSASLN